MVPTSARLTFSPVQRCLFAGHRLRVQMLLSSLNRRCQCRGLTVISRKTLNTGIRVGRVTSCDTGEDLGVKRSKVKEQGVTGIEPTHFQLDLLVSADYIHILIQL